MRTTRYEQYKESQVEWLGKVPSHWRVDRLKASISTCRNGIWGEEALDDDNDIPCVRVADFDRRRLRVELSEPTIRNVTEKERIGRVLGKGDLLLEKSGGGENQPVGCVVLYDDARPAVCSNFVARMVPAIGQNSSYWRYVHAAAYAIRLTVGSINQTSGIQNLDQARYFNEYAVFPPQPEQMAIAAFLDLETGKIDALVEEQRRLIELLKEKRQAVISRAVTKGLNPNVPMKKSGVQWLGKVPTHWSVSRLRYVARHGTSITYGIVQAGPHIEDGIPYIKTSDMSGPALPLDGYSKTTVEIDASYARSKVAAGDLVIAIRASVGKCLPVPAQLDGANLTQGTAKIAPGDLVDAGFLLAYINALPVQTYLNSVSKGATFKEITLDTLRKTPVLVPPLTEQRLIASHVHDLNQQFQELIDGAEAAEALLLERRTALISAAVTGKIDVRDWVPQLEAVAT